MSATPCQNRLSLRATFPCKPLVCREDRQSNERGAHRPAARRTLGSASRKQKGYTLLEIILALGLSVLVIGGITVAMNFHMVTLREQQEEIERAQIARQSLFMITRDIRSAIQYKPIETSALSELVESVEAATDLASLADAALSGEEAATDELMTEEEEAADSLYESTRPRLIGTSTELQIDVSRLPRKDEYNLVMFSDGTQSDIPSDVKTISYFVRNDENYEIKKQSNSTSGLSQPLFRDPDDFRGLVRRSLDRAVTRYSIEYGAQIQLEDYEEVLAREITEIEFRYWDQENQAWESEWDSVALNGMPGAVEVSIALGLKSDTDEEAVEDRKIYRSVVYLPIAEIIPPEPEPIPEEESAETGSTETGTGGER